MDIIHSDIFVSYSKNNNEDVDQHCVFTVLYVFFSVFIRHKSSQESACSMLSTQPQFCFN